MKRSLVIAFAVGLALAVALAAVIREAWPPEWKALQKRYYVEMLEKTGRPDVEVGIRELDGAGGRGKERCITCHLGMVLPSAGGPPFQEHPPTGCALPIGAIGCTPCHRGEPLKLTVTGVHGRDGVSRTPLLDWKAGKKRLFSIQAGCAACHGSREGGLLRYDRAVVPDVAAGMDIFLADGCGACHRVAGVYCAADNGPDLTGAGLRTTLDDLVAFLRAPQATFPSSPMPPVARTELETSRLALFLLAQVDLEGDLGSGASEKLLSVVRPPGLADQFGGDFPAAVTLPAGRALVEKIGCAGCHRVSQGGDGVPDLLYAGWTRNKPFLTTMLTDPRKQVPGTYMPGLPGAPTTAVESIVEFLAYERAPLPLNAEEAWVGICRPCHGGKRDPGSVVLARKPPLLEPGSVKMGRDAFMKTLVSGRKGTAMAPWGSVLLRSFLEELHVYLSGAP
jgi:mono/diheme cytochrome c family protein